jgi:hypothetical protein
MKSAGRSSYLVALSHRLDCGGVGALSAFRKYCAHYAIPTNIYSTAMQRKLLIKGSINLPG